MNVFTDYLELTEQFNETGNIASVSLARIEYWDETGNLKNDYATKENNWQIERCLDTWNVTHPKAGLSFKINLTINEDKLTFSILRDSINESKSCSFKSITPLPLFVAGKEDDGSTMVLPYEEGALCRCRGKEEGEYNIPLFAELPSYGSMSIFGIYNAATAIIAVIADGRLSSSLSVITCQGKDKTYAVAPVFAIRNYADERIMPEGIKVHYFLRKGEELSFVDFGKCYRDFNIRERKLPSLAEKMKNNPALEYSSKAISLRCRLGVKPLPVEILDQTPETQPPVNVMMSFDDVGMLVKECAKQQLGPTEFNLVGWNYGGHDGAFPQLFPVEQALGGEGKLRKLIELAHEKDYPISLHDCYFDAYSLANNFDIENINRNHDGTHTLGGQYGGGQSYQVCPQKAYDYAMENIPQVAELNINGAYYTDVLSVAQLTKCYHPDHEMSYEDNAYWWKKILQEIQSRFGVSYSEGARDWALPELDRAYLIGLTAETAFPFIDEKVPMFQVAYHGFLIYNSFRGGINTFPGDDIYLRNIAYGGMPIVYFHHIFNPAWNPDDGWDKDLTFEGPEKLTVDVARIKQISDDLAKYSGLQTKFIKDFIQHFPELTETVYENGSSVWVNYSKAPFVIADGTVVPAKDFIVTN